MKARQVLETCLYVDDLDAAERFYGDVLGLEKIARVEERHVFFRCGDGVFLLFNPEATAIDSGIGIPNHGAIGAGHVAFRMESDEIDAWRDHLIKHDVEIELEFTWPTGGYSIYFRDPQGNSVEFATAKTWGID